MTCKCTKPQPQFANAFMPEAGIVCATCNGLVNENMLTYEAAIKRAEREVFKKIKKMITIGEKDENADVFAAIDRAHIEYVNIYIHSKSLESILT